MRKILVLVLAACAALTLGLLGPPSAVASEPQGGTVEMTSTEESAANPSSPQCGPTEGHGKILYQACVRFNCDATSCLVRGFMGMINKATSPRTVVWALVFRNRGEPNLPDGSGQVTIPAGEQRTAYSPNTHRVPCPATLSIDAYVKYDSSGWSPQNPTDNVELDC